MSNQVYSNEQHKYYPQPGIIKYDHIGSVQQIAGGATAIVVFNHTALSQVQGLVSMADTGVLTILEDGIYSLRYLMTYENGAADNTLETAAAIRYTGIYASEDVLDFSITNTPYFSATAPTLPLSPATTQPIGSTSLSYVGYFNAGDIVWSVLTNINGGTTLDLIAGTVSMYVCKLA